MRYLLPSVGIPFLRSSLGMLLVLTLCAPAALNAQGAMTIQGKIVDAKSGQALAGANVFVKELGVGSVAGPDGAYSFVIPAERVAGQEALLTARYLGYREKLERITINGGTLTKDFALSEDPLGMQEVVITGVVGGTYKEKLPFTVDRISASDIQKVPAKTAESALRGKVAGVKIVQGSGQPGTVAAVQMRGATSINTAGRAKGPLYIVDGVILGSSTVDIDALDIDNIEVVKGAAAASLYGSRAAAGVVQIQTNRAQNLPDGETRVTFRNEYGRNSLVNKISLSKAHHFKYDPSTPNSPWRNYAGRDTTRLARVPDTLYRFAAGNVAVGSANTSFKDKPYVGTLFDQIDEFFDPGSYYTNTLSVAHRSRNTNLMVSLSNRNESGIIDGHEGYGIQSIRVNADHRFMDQFNLSVSAFHSSSKRDDLGGNPFYGLTFMPPDVDLRWPNSPEIFQKLGINPTTIAPADGSPYIYYPDPGQTLEQNPLYGVHNSDLTQLRKRTLGSGSLRWAPYREFDVEGNVSYDRLDQNYKSYYPKGYKTVNASSLNTGRVYVEDTGNEALNASLTASFNYDIGELSTRSKVRYLFEQQKTTEDEGAGNKLVIGDIQTLTNVSTDTRDVTSYSTEIKSAGYYFITGFDYMDRYITDFLIRRDGSSLFGSNERWQTYFRASGAWRMAQESWWFAPEEVNEFKLRYSIGTAGTRPAFAAQYETWNISGGSVSKGTLGNKDLRPEFSTEQEYGVEVGLFDRVLLELIYSNKLTKDQIDQPPLSAAAGGYLNWWTNVGTVETKTTEASLKAFIIQTPDVSLSSTFLFDMSRQKITELNTGAYRYGPNQQSGAVFLAKAGEDLGVIYGRRWLKSTADLPANLQNTASQWQANDDGYLVPVGTGNSWSDGITKKLWGTNLVLTDANGAPQGFPWGMPVKFVEGNWPSGVDIVKIGNVIPDFNIAFNTNFRYMGFSVYVLFDAQIGGDIYNLTRQWAYRDLMSGDNDQIGKTNETKKPLAYYSALYSTNITNSHFIEDGTYMKLRELSVRYTFDREDLSSFFGGWINRLSVALIGRNLITWTDYSGYDPEVGNTSGQGDATIFRFDGYYYPNYRNISGSLEFEF
ncbi:MAG: SusC/RagA family TonB-linked outer membrane protein [Ignavibacteriales bacterium]|nr:SusC/RagA family TonB-linked outer membrane protein [Ignavibacteriales bacterium]